MSSETSTSRRRPVRLVLRVAAWSALAALLGGAIAAGVAAFVAHELVDRHADANVRLVLDELANEVSEELHDMDEDDDDDLEYGPDGVPTLPSVLQHELKDVRLPGATALIVLRDGTRVGDASLPLLEPGRCETVTHAGRLQRVCALAFDEADGDRILLGVDTDEERTLTAFFGWALGAGVLVGALASGLFSLRGARWALEPLTALRNRVRAVDTARPRPEVLEPAMSHQEVEELRLSVAQLVAHLGDSLQKAQSFAASAAHELRTPLALLAGELELMAEDRDFDRAALQRVRERLDGLVALVQRLLVLAAPAGERVGGEAIDLADSVERAVAGLLPASAARVRMEAAPDVIVRGDAALLQSLVTNALENALKFSTGRVTVSVDGEADLAVVEVADEGPGISAAERERVFAPFYRTSGALGDRVPGYGLGLALIAHVARAHGGEAAFVDVPRGARLRVTLPRWRAPEA